MQVFFCLGDITMRNVISPLAWCTVRLASTQVFICSELYSEWCSVSADMEHQCTTSVPWLDRRHIEHRSTAVSLQVFISPSYHMCRRTWELSVKTTSSFSVMSGLLVFLNCSSASCFLDAIMSSWIFNTVLLDHPPRHVIDGLKKNQKLLLRSVDQFSRYVDLLPSFMLENAYCPNCGRLFQKIHPWPDTFWRGDHIPIS